MKINLLAVTYNKKGKPSFILRIKSSISETAII